VAEARQLVTSRVYRWVRHGRRCCAPCRSRFSRGGCTTKNGLLSETFPEYTDYKERTAMLLPGIF
jgi:protein-S-isoprenylcysteine O-methyltransferase Ste14